ncbi:hypothetical protein HK102_000197, partial [Quaeritorhiza haematococci]
VLQETLKAHICEDEVVQAMAYNQRDGWLNIGDERVFMPYGRVPDPEDIIGGLRIKDGFVVPGTFERMPTHRLVTINGLFRLTEFMHGKLVEQLKKAA